MFALLPFVAFIVLLIISYRQNGCWRSSFLSSAVTCGTLLALSTEVLSWLKLLTFGWLAGFWIAVILGSIAFYYRINSQNEQNGFKNPIPEVGKFLRYSPTSFVLLSGIIFIVGTVGLIAIAAPPNTWDSMTYHMPRVVHWAQNHHVGHYPTYNLAQLFHPPFAEFGILHLQLLSGSDRFANFVQWFSMVGSILGVSLIAKQLGAKPAGQILAAVFCATLPMGILQGSSTQNDYAVCFWLVCLASFVVEGVQNKLDFPISLRIGSSLGLAILTKSSGYIYSFPFLVWLFFTKLGRFRWRIWQPFAIITGCFVALNLNHYLRNLAVFGSLIPSPGEFAAQYKIGVFSVPVLISNIVRNLSLHVDILRYFHLNETPLSKIYNLGIVHKLILIFHQLIGVDPGDSRTTSPPGWYQVPGISFDENVANNPFHLFLLFLAFILFVFLLKKKITVTRTLLFYGLAIVGGFLFLCLLLKIQQYHPRHHLSLFVLFSAFVGVVFTYSLNSKVTTAIAAVLIVSCMPWVFNNKFRPIAAEANILNTSRIEQYFAHRDHLSAPYQAAVNTVASAQCSAVGLWLGGASDGVIGNAYWEYPLWVLFQQTNLSDLYVGQVNVRNLSAQKLKQHPYNSFHPCAVISVKSEDDRIANGESVDIHGQPYQQTWSEGAVSVLIQQ